MQTTSRIRQQYKDSAFSQIIAATAINNIGEYIRTGNNAGTREFAYLVGRCDLEIGDDCIIGQYFSCNPERLIRLQGLSRKGIKIGRNCWIGSKATIFDGVSIGGDCVIAAGAVVTKSMASNSIIGGVPAKIIKQRTGFAQSLMSR